MCLYLFFSFRRSWPFWACKGMDCNLSPCLFLLPASILWTRFQKLGPLRRPTQEGSSTHLSARCACKVSNEKGCRVDSQRSVCHFPETSVFKAISVLHKIETSKPVPLTCPSWFQSNSLIAWICLARPSLCPFAVHLIACFCLRLFLPRASELSVSVFFPFACSLAVRAP